MRDKIRQQENLLEKAGTELEQAEAEFQAASARLDSARRHHELARFEVSDLKSQVDRLQEQRRHLCAPQLAGFIRELWKVFDAIRATTTAYERVRSEAITGKRVAVFLTNGPAVEVALKALRGVIDKAEQLRSHALTDEEVETAIEKMRGEIPDPIEVSRQEERVDFAPVLNLDKSLVRYVTE